MTPTNELWKVGRDEYDLNRLADPKAYDDLQMAVADAVWNHFTHSRLNIIDIGVGTGDTSVAIGTHPRALASDIICLDYDGEMIKQAEKKLRDAKQMRATTSFVCNRAETYLSTLAPESIDAVVSVLALHNNPSETRQKVYQDIFRVMKKDGIFVLGDKMASQSPQQHSREMTKMLMGYLKLIEIGRRDAFEYWIQHNIRDDQPDLQMTLEDTLDELRKTAFIDTIVYDRNMNMNKVIAAYKKRPQ